MLPEGVVLRPMVDADVEPVLRIIRRHDEDDYEEAKEMYEELGVGGQYVLASGHKVIGATGCREIEGTDRSYWLSWTYLDKAYRGEGMGEAMISEMLSILGEMGARKVFINTSDYADELGDSIYADAVRCYESLGFRRELTYKDYYAPGESRLTFGRRIGPLYVTRPRFDPAAGTIDLVGVEEIDETDDAYYIGWEYVEEGSAFPAETLREMIGQVREWKGRCLFIGLSSDLAHVGAELEQAGFVECGRLIDFYEDGLDEVHYRLNLG